MFSPRRNDDFLKKTVFHDLTFRSAGMYIYIYIYMYIYIYIYIYIYMYLISCSNAVFHVFCTFVLFFLVVNKHHLIDKPWHVVQYIHFYIYIYLYRYINLYMYK